ncbi:MAG: hypothetical protein EAZ91_05345 [Cytophagales bacterium]|nr:MAG: hypothetical protein EAZ91_05345 [Cytophagales bacterium]
MILPEDLQYLFKEEQAVYGPWDHQRAISKLNGNLAYLYYQEKEITLEPLPEAMLDEAEASPVPDLILVDSEQSTVPIIIEVCHDKGLKRDIEKVIRLVDQDYYGIREGFIYNYKKGNWYRYKFGEGGLITESSFSEILNLDLGSFL